ncbi:putative mitochondrial distribution and morphology protein 10 [Rosellinia necatrix]|uniref:Mitochondrial distribution and morphology protein 10 n=1 Tax=Rosellinia necatrix TaxID=77044 RepID=A0A1W2TKP7_ROSNE|nr:putative mitochondrial distribution and morphology protein 10 [Rosellinia necatrix]
MREFMEYIQSAFYGATGWNRDNSYSALNATSDALLGFTTPRGLRLTLSSLATSHFATAYQLGTVGVVDGSISYLYSTVPLDYHAVAESKKIPLPDLLQSYSPLAELERRNRTKSAHQDVLAYGRLYLPTSMLEALMVKRISPTLQMQVSAVSDQTLRNGGTVLGMMQCDEGRYGVEGLASSDGGLLGIRGLYNFGGDVAGSAAPNSVPDVKNGTNGPERDRIYGRFSAGGELYYGTLNKSGGMSLGTRFATLPSHKGTPLTATMTVNPLMGTLSWTYAVMAGRHCSLGTKMDFNVYSYESSWSVGMELWRKKGTWTVEADMDEAANMDGIPVDPLPRRSFQAKMEWRMDDPLPLLDAPELLPTPAPPIPQAVPDPITKQRTFRAKLDWRQNHEGEDEDLYSGVLKARLDHHWRVGLLWEGRIKSLLFSLGSGIDLRRPDSPFRTLGLEVQFSS